MKTTHLQGIGKISAKQVKDLAPGDVVMWNYGYKSTVLRTLPTPTGKMYNVVMEAQDTGKVSVRRLGAERLIGIAR